MQLTTIPESTDSLFNERDFMEDNALSGNPPRAIYNASVTHLYSLLNDGTIDRHQFIYLLNKVHLSYNKRIYGVEISSSN